MNEMTDLQAQEIRVRNLAKIDKLLKEANFCIFLIVAERKLNERYRLNELARCAQHPGYANGQDDKQI